MSLIPYESGRRAVVLRHQSTVVLFDSQSKQLSIRSTPREHNEDTETCPTCGRSFRDESPRRGDREDRNTNLPEQTTYMDKSYFRMLQRTLPVADASSRSASPRRIDSTNLDRRASEIVNAPYGAQFVASQPANVGPGISKTAFSPNYFKTFFREERELGRGGKGVVLLVTHAIDGVHLGQFACKRVPVGDDHAWLEKVLIEVQTLQNLSHPNLVSYRHVWLEDYQISNFGPSVPCAFILQQYCNGKDLHQYVLGSAKETLSPLEMKERMRRRSKGRMEDVEGLFGPKRIGFEEIYSFFKDITSGLHHLHSHGFIHRDIKPQNCLLNHVDGKIRVLLSDFGEVQVSNVERVGTGATGTVSYCAPEVLRRHSSSEIYGNFTVKSDVFSVGMIVHFLSFGGLPYLNADDVNEENEDVEQLKAEIVAWEGFDEDQRRGRNDLPDMLYKFLKRLLAINPDDRPSTEEILRMIRGAQDNDFSIPPIVDGRNSRISLADSPSPYPRSQYHRKSSASQQQPLIRSPRLAQSNLAQAEAVEEDDSDKSVNFQDKNPERSNSHPHSPLGHNTIVRTHSQDLQSGVSPPVRVTSPQRLALPPPPRRILADIYRTLIPYFKVALFALKYWSITAPCRPLSTKPAYAYPLMIMAALDFMSSRASLTLSFFSSLSFCLLVVHVVVISWTTRHGNMCETLYPHG